jgi:hypothetical protein
MKMELSPRDVLPGDIIPGHYDGKPVKNVSVNPRGCKGKTHIDGGCWDNASTVDVFRK